MGEVSSKKVYVNIYVVTPDGKMSDFTKIKKSDIYKKEKTCMDFLYDIEGFGRDEIDVVKTAVIRLMKNEGKIEETQSRATLEELHEAVSSYIRKKAEDLEDNMDAFIFIRDGFGFITTTCMDDFVKNHKELGYKRTEILERLKVMGALCPASNRSYDTLVSVNGNKLRCYKIELVEEKSGEEEAVEVITVEEKKVFEV